MKRCSLGFALLTLFPERAGSSDQPDSRLRSVLRTMGLERAAGFTWADAAARHVTLYERCAQLQRPP